MFRAPPGVIAVGMGNDGSVNWKPRVDVEVAGLAIESSFSGTEKIGACHVGVKGAGFEPGEAVRTGSSPRKGATDKVYRL